MIDRLLLLLGLSRVTTSMRLVEACRTEARKLNWRLTADSDRLKNLRDRLEVEAKRLAGHLAEAEEVIRRQQSAIEALQDKIRIMSDSTIPAMVDSAEMIRAQIKANIAASTRAQVLFEPQKE